MKHIQLTALLFLFITIDITSCKQTLKPVVQEANEKADSKAAIYNNEYLRRVYDMDDEAIGYGYVNKKGDTVIALGKYAYCFTDTFRSYAIVWMKDSGFVAIDRQEQIMYPVFPFDNGPDEPSDGLFRILQNKKIGYADALTGKIVIQPQFDCAFPFEKGLAQVSTNCQKKAEGEHSVWLSDQWFYIDTTGKKVNMPK